MNTHSPLHLVMITHVGAGESGEVYDDGKQGWEIWGFDVSPRLLQLAQQGGSQEEAVREVPGQASVYRIRAEGFEDPPVSVREARLHKSCLNWHFRHSQFRSDHRSPDFKVVDSRVWAPFCQQRVPIELTAYQDSYLQLEDGRPQSGGPFLRIYPRELLGLLVYSTRPPEQNRWVRKMADIFPEALIRLGEAFQKSGMEGYLLGPGSREGRTLSLPPTILTTLLASDIPRVRQKAIRFLRQQQKEGLEPAPFLQEASDDRTV